MWINRDELAGLQMELATIRKLLFFIIKLETIELSDLTTLTADVASNTAETATVVADLAALKATAADLQTKLDAALAGNDTVAIAALSTQIEKNTADLAAAVAAVTPAPPPPPVA